MRCYSFIEFRYILLKLIGHDALSVDDINVCKVHERAAHQLVQFDCVSVLHELTNNLGDGTRLRREGRGVSCFQDAW